MIAQGFSADAPTTASSPGATARMDYSTHLTTMLWPAILVVAAVVGSLALTCVIPFAAFAVATAGTLRLRSALGTMAVMWLINQAVGFGALGYPWTLNTVLWGLAIGAAGLSATFAASAALHRFRSSPGWVRLPIAFVTGLRTIRSRAGRRGRASWWGSFCAGDRRAFCPDQRGLAGWIGPLA